MTKLTDYEFCKAKGANMNPKRISNNNQQIQQANQQIQQANKKQQKLFTSANNQITEKRSKAFGKFMELAEISSYQNGIYTAQHYGSQITYDTNNPNKITYDSLEITYSEGETSIKCYDKNTQITHTYSSANINQQAISINKEGNEIKISMDGGSLVIEKIINFDKKNFKTHRDIVTKTCPVIEDNAQMKAVVKQMNLGDNGLGMNNQLSIKETNKGFEFYWGDKSFISAKQFQLGSHSLNIIIDQNDSSKNVRILRDFKIKGQLCI